MPNIIRNVNIQWRAPRDHFTCKLCVPYVCEKSTYARECNILQRRNENVAEKNNFEI